MTKDSLRILYKNKRKSLSKTEREKMSLGILYKITTLDIIPTNSNFHIFFPIENFKEVNTNLIIKHLKRENKNIIVPKVYNDSMRSCDITGFPKLSNSKWNIPEPKICEVINPLIIDVVFIPLLICDTLGNRIGYGKGFYDTFLATCRKDVVKIGLNYFKPVPDLIPTYKNDIALDLLVVPERVYKF